MGHGLHTLHFEVMARSVVGPMFLIDRIYRLVDDIASPWPQSADPGRRTTRIRISGRLDIDVAWDGTRVEAKIIRTRMLGVQAR